MDAKSLLRTPPEEDEEI